MKQINEQYIPKNPMTLLQYINELYRFYENLIDLDNKEEAEEVFETIQFMKSKFKEYLEY